MRNSGGQARRSNKASSPFISKRVQNCSCFESLERCFSCHLARDDRPDAGPCAGVSAGPVAHLLWVSDRLPEHVKQNKAALSRPEYVHSAAGDAGSLGARAFSPFSHKFATQPGALLASRISHTRFDANLRPHGTELYRNPSPDRRPSAYNREPVAGALNLGGFDGLELPFDPRELDRGVRASAVCHGRPEPPCRRRG